MSTITTQFIDPVYHSNNRTVFKLYPDRAFTPDIRIANLGVEAASGHWSFSAGVYGLIKTIKLLDGGIEVDSITMANLWLSFQNQLKSNQENKYVTYNTEGVSLGYDLAYNVEVAAPTATLRVAGLTDALVAGVEASGFNGSINLAEVFPLLKTLKARSMKDIRQGFFKLKDPRVEIEWENTIAKVLIDTSIPGAITVVEPVLIADLINDDSLPQMEPVQFRGIEMDRLILKAVADGTTDSDKHTVMGFNQKTVGRMLWAIQEVADANGGGGVKVRAFHSNQQKDEKITVLLNGQEFYSVEGINQDNKLKMLEDVWGSLNCGLGSEKYLCTEINNVQENADTRVSQFRGRQGWIPVDLEENQVKKLEIVYTRKGSTEARQRAQAYLFMFGEVQKAVFMDKNGRAVVEYVN